MSILIITYSKGLTPSEYLNQFSGRQYDGVHTCQGVISTVDCEWRNECPHQKMSFLGLARHLPAKAAQKYTISDVGAHYTIRNPL